VLVNVFDLGSEEEARDLQRKLAEGRGHAAFCRVRGKQVFEFSKTDVAGAVKTAMEMGLAEKPQKVRYRVVADLALADDADGAESTEMLNEILESGGVETERIRELREQFRIGNSVVLRDGEAAGWQPEFKPAPEHVAGPAAGIVVYQFGDTVKVFGVPLVHFKAEIPCEASGLTETGRRADESLLAASDAWPVDDPDVKRLVRDITRGKRTQEDKVQAVFYMAITRIEMVVTR
jgi:hypothetical protein